MPSVPAADAKTRNLTMLLDGLNGGDAGAFARVVDEVYADLKRIANKRMADRFDQPQGALTMQATAIANDAVMELRRQRVQWQNSDQFFAIATRLIERLISGYRKQRNAQKRGGGKRGAPIEHAEAIVDPASSGSFDAVEAVSEALAKLHDAYPRKAEVVTLHVLCGHPLSKVKEMVGVEQATVERDWAFAKKWLARELRDDV